MVAWNCKLSFTPDFSLSDALEEDGEVHAFPVCAEAETIFVARCCVSDNYAVTRIAVRALTRSDVSVAVHIYEFHVARCENDLVAILELHLIYRVFRCLSVGCTGCAVVDDRYLLYLSVCAIDEIVFLEQSVGNITVDVTIASAGRVSV